MTTETIDKLYLELSKVTTAKTERELLLEDVITKCLAITQGYGIWESYSGERLRQIAIQCERASQ